MQTTPVPIVIVSASVKSEEVQKSWQAVEAGAVAVLEKPRFMEKGQRSPDIDRLVRTVKLMSQVKVVRRWKRTSSAPLIERDRRKKTLPKLRNVEIAAIGASTGGPPVLQSIFSQLPADFAVPILVVQHIAPGFSEGFVEWLSKSTPLELTLAVDGQRIEPGCIYVAPDECQMRVRKTRRISVTPDEAVNGHAPSVSCLFQSVAESFGQDSIGILLTGMGRDGANELKTMRDCGALTIAQEKESCIVYGMPGEAEKLGAAEHFLAPEAITGMLKKLETHKSK
jgi:two-component system chemotaxis response regulator CheB